MKVKDQVEVKIEGQTVCMATVKELGDGTATLVVPATLVVMATRTELTVEEPMEQQKETQLLGVEQHVETAPVDESAQTTTVEQPAQVEVNEINTDTLSADTVNAEVAAPVELEAKDEKPSDSDGTE